MVNHKQAAGFAGGFGGTVAAGRDGIATAANAIGGAVGDAAASLWDLVPLAMDALVVVV